MAGIYLKQRNLCDQAKWSSQRRVQHESLCTVNLGNCKRSHVKKMGREGAHRVECMYKGIPRYFTEYGDIDSFFSRPTLVRIRRSGSGHVQVRCPARGTLPMTRCFDMLHMLCTRSHYIVFLLALCPLFLFAFASFSPMHPDGSFPSSSHSSSIFVAARYPLSCISSNLPHCSVPYYQFPELATCTFDE